MRLTIPKRPRINDVLTLRSQIEQSRDDLSVARHELGELQRGLRRVELLVGTVGTHFETIVELYNRVAVEYRGAER